MQSDTKDDVAKTVRALCVKQYTKDQDEIKELDDWIAECPCYDDKLQGHLQSFREGFVKEQCKDSDEFEELVAEYAPKIQSELEKIVALRKSTIADETKVLDDVAAMLKASKIAERAQFRVLKYYPTNDVHKFRPFGKVSGIHESGESADICEPPAYVFRNAFALAP